MAIVYQKIIIIKSHNLEQSLMIDSNYYLTIITSCGLIEKNAQQA